MNQTLYEKFEEIRKDLRRNRETQLIVVLNTFLGYITSAWTEIPVAKRGQEKPDDAFVELHTNKYLKLLAEGLASAPTEAKQVELDYLSQFKPAVLSNEDVQAIVFEHLESYTPEKGNKIKYVMDHLKLHYANKYDSRFVMSIIPK